MAVMGDGAVGLMAVLSAKQLGAERIILLGRHQSRTDLGVEFGATDVVAERGAEGIGRVRELTGGHGVRKVLEAVGHRPAYEQAFGIVRPGGVISRVGVPSMKKRPLASAASLAATSLSPAAPHRSARTLTSCCRLSSTAPSTPAESLTAPLAWTTSPMPTAPWMTEKPSK